MTMTETPVTDLIDFLDASPSPWHVVESVVDRLDGFTRLDERDAWDQLPDAGYVVRSGAVIAWRLPDPAMPAHAPFRLVGAHTDSPCLRVKPRPDTGGFGWRQLAVEVYGGILNNSWLDRDLGIAGRVIGHDGTTSLVNVAEPVARVPQLAVHLDRDVNSGGLTLDTQQHLTPVWGVGQSTPGEFAAWLRRHRRARRRPVLVGVVPLRRPGRSDHRGGSVDVGLGAPRQPGIVLGRHHGPLGGTSRPITWRSPS
jgi:aspartyl aminopeptidase